MCVLLFLHCVCMLYEFDVASITSSLPYCTEAALSSANFTLGSFALQAPQACCASEANCLADPGC